MPRSNRRAIQSQVTKQMLYESAMRLFRANGYYNTTVEDIASAAGISVGAFYYHFKCKEDVIFLMADELDKSYDDFYTMQLATPHRGSALDMLRATLLFMISRYCNWGREFATVSYSYIMREPEVSKRMLNEDRADRRILRNLVEMGQKEGCIRSDRTPRQIANDLVKVIRGAILDWCISGGDSDVNEYSGSYVETFLNGLRTGATD